VALKWHFNVRRHSVKIQDTRKTLLIPAYECNASVPIKLAQTLDADRPAHVPRTGEHPRGAKALIDPSFPGCLRSRNQPEVYGQQSIEVDFKIVGDNSE
jgi:hypothetical protein